MGRQDGANLIAFGVGTVIAHYAFGITDPVTIITPTVGRLLR